MTGGAASCGSPAFWQALPFALVAGFVTPLPYVRTEVLKPRGT